VSTANVLDFSPDGTKIVIGSFVGSAQLWDVQTGQLITSLKAHGGPVLSARFNSDGAHLLTAGEDGGVGIWDIATNKPVLQLTQQRSRVWSAAYNADESLVITGSGDRDVTSDNTARVWDASSGVLLGELRGHLQGIYAVAIDRRSQRIVTTSLDNTTRLWNWGDNGLLQTSLVESQEPHLVHVDMSRSANIAVAASTDGRIRVWHGNTGEALRTLDTKIARASRIAIGPNDARIAVGTETGELYLIDTASGQIVLKMMKHQGSVLSIGFSMDGAQVATGGSDGRIIVWDCRNGAKLHELEMPRSAAKDADQQEDDGNEQRQATTGSIITNPVRVTHAGFSEFDDRLITVSTDAIVRIWDSRTYKLLKKFAVQETSPDFDDERDDFSARFNQDGTRLVSRAFYQKASAWNTRDGERVSRFIVPKIYFRHWTVPGWSSCVYDFR
jgi:WD40 repeat protein